MTNNLLSSDCATLLPKTEIRLLNSYLVCNMQFIKLKPFLCVSFQGARVNIHFCINNINHLLTYKHITLFNI